ncbi:MAG: asparagine synthase (glutamine-hydrolyzing) [Bradymonadia bacterium]
MCGIAGLAGFSDPTAARSLLERMTDAMLHRGPDDVGFHHDGDVHLGHRRLAIIDPEGTEQPLRVPAADARGRGPTWVVFNGEIYNHRALRQRLEGLGHIFRHRGDTEVIPHAYAQWGDDCLRYLNGMFGLAIWDPEARRLLIARDRFGEKPVYYLQDGPKLLFASEIKPLLAYEGYTPELDPQALDGFLTLRYACHPDTFFKGIKKLPPGHVLIRDRHGVVTVKPWYTLRFGGEDNALPRGDHAIAEAYGELLEDSVRLRMEADVPLGAFLSGGIDSNAFTYFMTRHSPHAVKTFTLGFGGAHDEVDRARAFADTFATEHRSVQFTADHLDVLPRVIWHLEEPIGDAMTVAWFHLLQFIKNEVTVGLIGGGSDEVLAGYVHHLVLSLGELTRPALPRALRAGLIRRAVSVLPVGLLGRLFRYPAELGQKGRERLVDYLLHQESPSGAYRALVPLFSEGEKSALYTDALQAQLGPEPRALARRMSDLMDSGDEAFLDRLVKFDTRYYMSDFSLLTGDKNTMAYSFELRLPFLDPRLVEFSARLSSRHKLRAPTRQGVTDKWVLRAAMKPHLPAEITARPKQGFHVPVDRLFPDGFAQYARSILTPDRIRQRGLFRPEAVEALIGQLDHSGFVVSKQLMALVVLELWCRIFLDNEITFEPSVVPQHRPPRRAG